MTILRPSTTVSFVMPLACLMVAAGTLYFELIPESVSPATTVWMMAAPLEGALGAGAAGMLGSAAGAAALCMPAHTHSTGHGHHSHNPSL